MPNSIRHIRYINSFAAGTQHRVFNRATLSMFADLWRGCVSVYSVPSSLPHLLTADNTADIRKWRKLPVASVNSPAGLALRYLQSALCNIWQLLRAGRDELVVYNFNNVFSAHAIDVICRCTNRNVLVFCHNELEYLQNAGKHKSLQKRILSGLTRSYFSKKRRVAPGLRFVVLGDSILHNLRPLVSSELYERFTSMDHPITPAQLPPRPATDDNRTLNIGTVGIVNYYKGAAELAEIASEIGKEPGISFRIVGSVQGSTEPFSKAGITLPPHPSEPMAEAEFSRAVAALDFILLLYPADTYRLMASGAVLEALRYGKPIIAYRTSYFDYLFRKFGAFGYLADSREEMIELLRSVDSLSRDFPFREIASHLSVQAIAPAIKKFVDSYED